MENFLIIISIHLLISLVCFRKNYNSIQKDYFVKDALRDFILCFIPVINIFYLFDEIIENIRYKLHKILNKKLK